MRRILLVLVMVAVALVGARAQSVLVQAGDLAYVGGFRVPVSSDIRYELSGQGLAYDAASDTLFVANYANLVSELSIPTPSTGPVSSWPRASQVQPKTNILRGKMGQAGNRLGGLLVVGNDLIAAVHIQYDASRSGRLSHFRVSKDFTQSNVSGPVELSQLAGVVGGPMTHIPQAWQSLLGGPALTGLCCVSIVTRSSYGPAASVFDPADITPTATTIPSTQVVAYPSNHHTLGDWNSTGTLWNSASYMGGMVFIEGTNSVLWFGRKAATFCYGTGRDCGDPTNSYKGTHGYPYTYHVWAYDADDFVKATNGQLQPWQVVPYAVWDFDMPDGTNAHVIRGAAYDPGTQRIFLTEEKLQGNQWVGVRVLQFTGSVGPPPPPPSPVDCVVSAWSPWTPIDTVTETRTRTVITPSSNGGASCPALVETQPIPDDDGDGVNNANDLCPGTPPSVVVDAAGCAAPPPAPDYAAEIAALDAAMLAFESASIATQAARWSDVVLAWAALFAAIGG